MDFMGSSNYEKVPGIVVDCKLSTSQQRNGEI